MLYGKLPKTIDPCKLARQGMQFEGSLPLNHFSRLKGVISDDHGEVKANLHFIRNEDGRTILKGHAEVICKMVCQRCLDIADIPVYTDIKLMAVWTDRQASALSSEYEPLFLQDDPIELVQLLEDELLLALPLIPYHDDREQCLVKRDYTESPHLSNDQGKQNKVDAKKANPFSILSKLKTDTKTTIQES